MAIEKFIRGKIDSARHAGRHSNQQRLDAALDAEQDPYKGDPLAVDPYHNSLLDIQERSIHEEGLEVFRNRTLFPPVDIYNPSAEKTE